MKREELGKKEGDLRSVMGRGVIRGVDSVKRVIEEWKKDRSQEKRDLVRGYRGMLIENIRCDELVYTAVDTVAQNKLFNHIVDNDVTATRILEEINRMKFGGETTFLPLNRVGQKEPTWPDFGTVEVMPLIEKITYKEDIAPAVHHVFGKTVVCRYLDVATDVSKQYHLDCVTPDGDTVNRRGPMFGGKVLRFAGGFSLSRHSFVKFD